jgi:hypothetical protein
MVRRLGLPTLALFLLLAPAAAAQPAKGKAAADALFRDGRAAFDKGDYPKACEKFEASQNADPAPGTLLNLAVCEEKMGRLKNAQRHLTEVIPQLGAKDERLGFAKDLAAKIDARLPRLTLALPPGAPPDAAITVDGQPAKPGEALVLEPGEHEIVLSATGRSQGRERVTLAELQREQRTVALGAPLEPGPDAKAAEGSGPLRRTIGIALGGVGVAGFITAGITGGLLLSKKSAVDARCPNKRCDAEGVKLLADAKSTPLLPVNTASWIIGVVGVSAGAVLVLTSGILGSSGGPKASALVVPVMLPGGGGIGASGAF